MNEPTRVRLIYDPFGICRSEGTRVSDVAGERRAFREIDELLSRDERYDTVTPRSFIIDARCWDHFRSYTGARSVSVERFTPRERLTQAVGIEPPDWLTDALLYEWGVHGRVVAPVPTGERWESVVTGWFIPGLPAASLLVDWLRLIASADRFPPEVVPGVRTWLADQLLGLSAGVVPTETAGVVAEELRDAESVIGCIRGWVRTTALLPVLRPAADKVLRVPNVFTSPVTALRAAQLPLVFPAPGLLRDELTSIYRQALQGARRSEPSRFADAVVSLNALWDGVGDELAHWLEIRPDALTERAARHLASLPGYEASPQAQRLVELYSPPSPVPPWCGLDGPLEAWVAAYSRYVRQCFIRRTIPSPETDPATGFGRWLKDFPTVSFSHEKYGYPSVSKTVTAALRAGRRVILAVVDALAAHVVGEAAGYLSDAFGLGPSRSTYAFAPIPTITEVCKEAIVTGRPPSDCNGAIRTTVLSAYNLKEEEVLLASNWEDAERLEIRPRTRLVFYRENRLDNYLKGAGNYRSVLEDGATIFAKIARLLTRWRDDLASHGSAPPLVLVTADHGFTYGPKPQPSVPGAVLPDGHSRCIELPEKPTNLSPKDESVTLIDKKEFRLRASYLAARGRYFGSPDGPWVLSHGGLLPEEVIIPVIEWYGDKVAIPWPEVVFPDGAERDKDGWVIPLVVRNGSSVPLFGGSLKLAVLGGVAFTVQLPRIEPGAERELVAEVRGDDVPEEQLIPFDVTVAIRFAGNPREHSQTKQYLVQRKRKLVERTQEQADFEQMFSR